MNKRKIVISALLILLSGSAAGALDVSGTPPTTGGAIDGFLSTAFDNTLDEVKKKIKGIAPEPTKLVEGFGNASVFAASGATARGYAGYGFLSVSLGAMGAMQLPYPLGTLLKDPTAAADNITDRLNSEHDLFAGASVQGVSAIIGLNTSKFLVKNLYLGLKIGFFPNILPEGFQFSMLQVGGLLSYQLIEPSKKNKALFLWRGISFNTGIIYQGVTFGYDHEIDDMSETDSSGYTVTFKPKLSAAASVHTVTIPLEAATAVRLFSFLNLTFGLGIDLGFGVSQLELKGKSVVDLEDANGKSVSLQSQGTLDVSAKSTAAPFPLNPKFMTGLGFSIGPVFLDIPITLYIHNGFSVGLSLGFQL